jgi:stearoyl-CoA desaturase (delta-9 desaturase)
MPEKTGIDPWILGPYIAVHLACLGVFWTGVSPGAIAICLGTYAARTFLAGLSYHRYFAHRSFKTSRPMQFLLAASGACALEGGPLWWAATHRYHHRHADTPEDLHSPRHQGFFYSHSAWFAERWHQKGLLSTVSDLAKFPELVWIDRWHPIFMVLWFGGMYLAWGWTGVVWGGCVSSVMVWHNTHCIQSFSHRVGGYRLFQSKDDSRNHVIIGLVSLGEWHNNHHYFPGSARQGFAWWEIDVVYGALRVLEMMGLVWDVQVPSKKALSLGLLPERRGAVG